jgi:hypothetical protein
MSFGRAKNFKPAHPEPKLEHKVMQRRIGFGDVGSGSIRSRGLSLSSLQKRFLSKFGSLSRRVAVMPLTNLYIIDSAQGNAIL